MNKEDINTTKPDFDYRVKNAQACYWKNRGMCQLSKSYYWKGRWKQPSIQCKPRELMRLVKAGKLLLDELKLKGILK
ncbi:MAG: hypothetical protein V1837_04990 [Candidatus Woesearchaeota archaeon]